MGRVLKGAAEVEERYTLAVPASVWPGAPRDGYVQETPGAVEPVPAAEPAEPEVDLEALRAQAQAIIEAAEREARDIVDTAAERAQALLEEAGKNAETIAQDALQQGHQEGYANGERDAQASMAAMLDTMRELLDAVRAERHALLATAEPELVRLAVGIAERVLHQQIALDHGVVVEMAKAAIARIVDREKITVRVNPADVERMREHRDELLALGDVKSMRVIEDQRVDRGGVVLETDAGSIDAKISTQLAEVRKILHVVDDPVAPSAPPLPGSNDDQALLMTAARAS